MAIPGLSPVRALVVFAAIAMLSLTSCTKPASDISEDKAQENFVNACQRQVKIENGAQVTIPLASEDFCKCVLDNLLNKFKIDNDVFKAFQERIDKGEDFTPPEQVTKSIAACTTSGPASPSETSTTTTPAG